MTGPRRPARRLSDLVQAAIAPAVQQHGFSTAEVIARWPEIVGPRFADVTRPLRVTWPRRAPGYEDRESSAGTLVVQCEGAHALDLQHAAPGVLERVNVFYGWRAVERLAIRQGPVRRAAPAAPPAADAPAPPVPGVDEPDLARALGRLGRAVAASRERDAPRGR